jgi:hypothetical protein
MQRIFTPVQAGAAALLTASMVCGIMAPVFTATPASAQLFRRQPDGWQPSNDRFNDGRNDGRPNDGFLGQVDGLPAGTVIPATNREGERILVRPDETLSLKLTVPNNVFAPRGGIVIPAGSEIEGQFQPSRGGTQFVARQIRFPDGARYNLTAISRPLTRIETIRRGVGTRTIVTGTLAGGATASIIAGALGKSHVLKSLGGAGIGALSSYFLGRRSVEVVVVDPRADLDLTLERDFRLGERFN